MKKPTKDSRRLQLVDAYTAMVNRPVTMYEVAEWAFRHGVAEVPAMRDSDDVHAEWERRLEAATIATRKDSP